MIEKESEKSSMGDFLPEDIKYLGENLLSDKSILPIEEKTTKLTCKGEYDGRKEIKVKKDIVLANKVLAINIKTIDEETQTETFYDEEYSSDEEIYMTYLLQKKRKNNS